MSRFQKHLALAIKHWPRRVGENDPLIRKFAEISSLAGLEEQDIEEFCDRLRDVLNLSYQNGISAAMMGEEDL